MKVMHVLSGDLWAGAEVMAINLLQGLQGCAGVELRAVVLNPGRPAREIESLGIPSTVMDENKRSFPGLLFELKKELEVFQPDVVHSHRYKENLLAYLATRGEQKIGLVRTQHGMPEKFGKSFSLKGWAIRQVNFRFLTRCFDCTVAVSDEMKYTMLSDFLSGPGKVVVIHNGVHPPTLASKYKGGEFVIGTCGRLCPVKNYSLFIDMAIRVHQEVPSVRFVLAGDGPEMDVLKERVHGYGLENYFDFLGHMDKMEDFFSRLDVYVNTSLHEGIPLSVLEAMVRGVPVVAPDVGGLREIIACDLDGFLLTDHVPELFAGKCVELYKDHQLRKKIGNAARLKIIDQFSVNHMAEGYYRLYNKILTSSY